jgi:hypothetical protein
MLNVRFVELAPRRRIVEAVSFVTTDACLDQIAGAFLGGDRQVAGPFCPSRCGSSGSVPPYAASTAAHQGLVEMHVTIDEAGQHQIAADIEDRHAVRRGWPGVLADGCDPPAGDADIDKAPIGEAAMGQECIERHDAFLAES